jgi:hypothetical protein
VLLRTEQRLHSGLLAERIRLAVMYEEDITALRQEFCGSFCTRQQFILRIVRSTLPCPQ